MARPETATYVSTNMSDGAFRDASAALERAAALEQRNAELEAELLELRGVASEAKRELKGDTLTSLRAELKTTLAKLTAATGDLKAVEDNYRALRRERDRWSEKESAEKTRADRLQRQLDSFNNPSHKDRTLKDQLQESQRANSRYKTELQNRDDQIVELQRRVLETNERIAEARAEVPENYQAFLSRLEEERQELLVEVKELRAKLEDRRRR